MGDFRWENLDVQPEYGCCGEITVNVTPPVRLYAIHCTKCGKKAPAVDTPERAVIVWDAMRRRENGG